MTNQQPQKPAPKNLLQKVFPKAVQINKKLVIIVAGVLLLIVLFIIFGSFRSATENEAHAQTAKLRKHADAQRPGGNIAAHLPASYKDAKAIDKLLAAGKGQNVPESVQRELNALKAQQTSLKQELAALKAQPTVQPVVTEPTIPQASREERNASIFFDGGQPIPPSQHDLNELNKQGNKSKTSKHNGSGFPKMQSSYEQQNGQTQKLSFLSSKPDTHIYNPNSLQKPVSKYEIQAGTEIPATLKGELDTDLPGAIVAEVSQNVYDSISGEHLLIPKGTQLIGTYNSKISYGQSSLQAKFTRMILPNGNSMVLPNQVAVGPKGMSGMKDDVDNHWGGIIGAAVLTTVFNIPSVVASNQLNSSYNYPGNSGGSIGQPSTGMMAGAGALQSLGQTTSSVGSQLTNKAINIQPTVIIHRGYRFSILVTKDMVLRPYHTPYSHRHHDLSGMFQ